MPLKTVFKGIAVKAWLKPIEGEAPMYEKLEIFQMARSMAAHATARQSVVARNIANADTPGYRAQQVAAFADTYQSEHSGSGPSRTRATHLATADSTPSVSVHTGATETSPNGNSVSLEQEMMNASEVRLQHDTALAVYKSAMNILRTSLGRR